MGKKGIPGANSVLRVRVAFLRKDEDQQPLKCNVPKLGAMYPNFSTSQQDFYGYFVFSKFLDL